MKVLLVSTLYHPNLVGGAERVVQKLAEALVGKGHEVSVACLGKEAVREQRVINGVRVHYLPVRNLYWPFGDQRPKASSRALWHALDTYNPLMAKQLGEVVREEQPDVVNSHNIAGFSVAAWSVVRQQGIPIVHTMHDQYLLCPNTTMFKGDRNCATPCVTCQAYSWSRKRHTDLVSVITGVSRFVVKRHLDAGCFAGIPDRVIYNACPSVAELLQRDAAPEIRPIRFGFLGRLDVTKGVEILLNAFVNIHSATAELWIAGKGRSDYEQKLQALGAGHSNIKWLGHVPPAKLLKNIDVLVVPSLWNDTAPLVVQEAGAYGVPVLGSQRGGIPELIGGGWTFEPSEPASLEAAMRRCIDHRRELASVGSKARESSSRFGMEAMLQGYIDAYELARATEGRLLRSHAPDIDRKRSDK